MNCACADPFGRIYICVRGRNTSVDNKSKLVEIKMRATQPLSRLRVLILVRADAVCIFFRHSLNAFSMFGYFLRSTCSYMQIPKILLLVLRRTEKKSCCHYAIVFDLCKASLLSVSEPRFDFEGLYNRVAVTGGK